MQSNFLSQGILTFLRNAGLLEGLSPQGAVLVFQIVPSFLGIFIFGAIGAYVIWSKQCRQALGVNRSMVIGIAILISANCMAEMVQLRMKTLHEKPKTQQQPPQKAEPGLNPRHQTSRAWDAEWRRS